MGKPVMMARTPQGPPNSYLRRERVSNGAQPEGAFGRNALCVFVEHLIALPALCGGDIDSGDGEVGLAVAADVALPDTGLTVFRACHDRLGGDGKSTSADGGSREE